MGGGTGWFDNNFKVLFCLSTNRTKYKDKHFRYMKNLGPSIVSILGLISSVTP